jgi:pyruvoyl-dependent arginine decarboxylase
MPVPEIFDHISVGVGDIERSAQFYDAVLKPLGLRRLAADGTVAIGFGSHRPEFWIDIPLDETRRATSSPGTHVAFTAPSREAVDLFFAAAIDSRGKGEGGPGLRPEYGDDYYAAFVLDPDGHKIEAVFRTPERSNPIGIGPATEGFYTPNRYFLVRGASEGASPLIALDAALLAAGIGNINIVKLSSILPAGANLIKHPKLHDGTFVGVAYATFSSQKSGATIAAAVAIGHPTKKDHVSVIREYAGEVDQHIAETNARSLAQSALIARGLEVDHIDTIAVQHRVGECGCVLAGVVEI